MEINLYKLKPTRKVLLITLIALAVLAVPVIYQLRQYNDPNSSLYKDVGFQLYVPTKLPSGVKITDRFLIADMPNIHGTWYSWFIWLKPTRLYFYMAISKNSGEGITEWKAGAKSSPLLDIDCTKDSLSSDICEVRTTPNGEGYEYLNGKDPIYGQTGAKQVNFIKNGTLINASVFIKNNTPISRYEWESFIDSFVPINADTVPFGHKSPGINVI